MAPALANSALSPPSCPVREQSESKLSTPIPKVRANVSANCGCHVLSFCRQTPAKPIFPREPCSTCTRHSPDQFFEPCWTVCGTKVQSDPSKSARSAHVQTQSRGSRGLELICGQIRIALRSSALEQLRARKRQPVRRRIRSSRYTDLDPSQAAQIEIGEKESACSNRSLSAVYSTCVNKSS